MAKLIAPLSVFLASALHLSLGFSPSSPLQSRSNWVISSTQSPPGSLITVPLPPSSSNLCHNPLSILSLRSTTCSPPLKLSSSPFLDATTDETSIQQKDSTGKLFSPGTIVAISSGGMKAYQVPKAAYGSFDAQTREFIPQDQNNVTRGTSCLILPEGLRGEVVRVYDVNSWDRTHPILVKFVEGSDRGEGVEGGFHVPKMFMMHFDSFEIKVVD